MLKQGKLDRPAGIHLATPDYPISSRLIFPWHSFTRERTPALYIRHPTDTQVQDAYILPAKVNMYEVL